MQAPCGEVLQEAERAGGQRRVSAMRSRYALVSAGCTAAPATVTPR
jgi:hypothetical protein